MTLGDLAAGEARALTADEVSALWTAVGGDGARAALRRASLLCCARSGADERLRAFFGSELDGPRCYAAFPGLSCAHDDVAAPAPKRARGADDAVLL